MWGNAKRDILLASGKTYQQQHYNFQQENTSNSTQQSHNFLPWKTCQVSTIVLPCYNKKNPQNSFDFCALLASKFVPSFPCMNYTDPYSTASNSSNRYQHTHTEICLGKCVQSPLGNAPSLLSIFLSQALSKISQSPLLMLCLTHYPMHSLII
jgi:hypothetical protein